jgi:hypothetical protein
MSEQVKVTLIVQFDVVGAIRSLCTTLAGEAAANMFETRLSATGLIPATHYISAGYISQEMRDIMELPQEIVNRSHGAVTLEEVMTLLGKCDISEEDPAEVLARLGLRLVLDEL